jgi:prepilin-type N-terminal cleavage/methylation domain-containing protein
MSLQAIRERLDVIHSRREAGFTLIELMVAMLVFSIFLAIVVTSLVGLTKSATRIKVAAVSSNQELSVFAALDRQIRYADGVNAQGTSGTGYSYFEFRTPSDSTASNLTTCTQWRYDPSGQTVAYRTWTDGNLATATKWNVLLTNVANDGGSNYPFKFIPASAGGSTLEEMQLTLDAGTATTKGATISSVFVARNSAVTASNPGGAVCPAAGSRP